MQKSNPNRSKLAAGQKGKLTARVQRILEETGLVSDKPYYDIDDAGIIQNYLYSLPPKYRLVIFSQDFADHPVFKGNLLSKNVLFLYHNNSHYDVIKNPNQFFSVFRYGKFCVDCETFFRDPKDHKRSCIGKCPNCCKIGEGPCIGEPYISCTNCMITFVSEDCFSEHKKQACKAFKKCLDCQVVYNEKETKKFGGHSCGFKYCRTCYSFHPPKRGCYISPLKIKKGPNGQFLEQKYMAVFYDFECMQHIENDDGTFTHMPNCLSAQPVCTDCMDQNDGEPRIDCELCGDKEMFWADWDLSKEEKRSG